MPTCKTMRWLTLLVLCGLILPWLTSCDDRPLALGQPGQFTLVFVYTDG